MKTCFGYLLEVPHWGAFNEYHNMFWRGSKKNITGMWIPLIWRCKSAILLNCVFLFQVIILEPTRELANQVAQDIGDISDTLAITCVYGGASYVLQRK